MKTNNNSYIKSLGLKNLGLKNSVIAFLKIVLIFPSKLFFALLKFLLNPTKSAVKSLQRIVVFPILEFFTSKNVSNSILEDYTYFHHAILKKELFSNENLKINFKNHKDILLNVKIANFISIFIFLLIYAEVFEILTIVQLFATGLSLVTLGLTLFLNIIFWGLKIYLTIAMFALEIHLLKSLFVTEKEDIKDYIDDAILYADIKNREIYGDEHADKVKKTMYDAYLTEKNEIIIEDIKLLNSYISHHQKALPGVAK